MLAPMEGYTDAALRTLCFRHGADLTFTEMTHVGSLLRGNRLTLERVMAHDSTPVQVQLLTSKEEELKRFIEKFKPFPGFKGFNLNLSCPSPDVINQGKGAALVKRAAKTEKLASTLRRCGYNVSLKMRLGTNAHEKALRVYLNCLRGVDAEFFIIHSKTASQGSSEAADYSVYLECVEAANRKPIIANGDIDSVEKVMMLRKMGVSGVMIGRAALTDPSIFDAIKNELAFNSSLKLIPNLKELMEVYRLREICRRLLEDNRQEGGRNLLTKALFCRALPKNRQ
jgi:tRNA-dihydrouridine synthase B